MLMAATAILFASCSKDSDTMVSTVDAGSSLTKKAVSKPIKGQFTYSFAPSEDLPCDCGDYYPVGTFEGTGKLSHLGKSYSQIKPCVKPLIQDGQQIGEEVGVECAFFVAANGDSLYCYTYPYNLYYSPVGAVGYATVDFTGGTGRFANASGTITGKVTVGPGGASFADISGNIIY